MITIQISDAECLITTDDLDTAKRLLFKNAKCETKMFDNGLVKLTYPLQQVQSITSILKGKRKTK